MKLSIITINYNNKDGLQKTIDSVICQTWHDFEWIIIDGGSTDGSKELIGQYQQHFTYWCSEPDKGIYNAMNKGIDHAQGEYLQFLNSGDCLHNSFILEKWANLNSDVDIFAAVSVNMKTGEPMKIFHPDIVRQLYFDSLNHQATFIRKILFDKHKYNEENKIASDWEFFVQSIIIDGCSFMYSDLVVVDFDIHGISNQSEYDYLQIIERKRGLDKYFSPYIRKDLLHYFDICDSYGYKKIQYLKKRYKVLYLFFVKIISCKYLLENALNKLYERTN